MDINDLGKAQVLSGQLRQAETGLRLFDAGGRIVSLTVASDNPDIAPRQTALDTSEMPYPAQMAQAIRSYLEERVQATKKQLDELGVTGALE